MLCQGTIGVFDSGLGGISVLKAIRTELPSENLVYLADKINAPYGLKSDEDILALTKNGAQTLLRHGAKAIVIACNTATSVAAETLRAVLDVPVIGLEPAVKPAFLHLKGNEKDKNAKILVLATPVTLSHPKFCRLIATLGAESFICVPAPRLVSYIESGKKEVAAAISYLKKILEPYQSTHISSCVLGCTHFPFAKAEITAALGYAPEFFDGAQGAASELRRQLERQSLLINNNRRATVRFLTYYPGKLQERLFLTKYNLY